jgi:hypothetical protein
MYRFYMRVAYNIEAISKYGQRGTAGERMFTSIIGRFKPGTTGEKAQIRWRLTLGV